MSEGDGLVSLRRYSIRTLALSVSACAVAFAALSSATQLWAIVIRDFIVFVFTSAVGGAIFDRGPRRASWTGLAMFGWLYFPPYSTLLGLGDGLASYGARRIALTHHPCTESMTPPTAYFGEATTFDVVHKVYGIDSGKRAANAERIMGDLIALAYGLLGGLITRTIAIRGCARDVSARPRPMSEDDRPADSAVRPEP
jgi:hypothetical protein